MGEGFDEVVPGCDHVRGFGLIVPGVAPAFIGLSRSRVAHQVNPLRLHFHPQPVHRYRPNPSQSTPPDTDWHLVPFCREIPCLAHQKKGRSKERAPK